MKSKKIQRRKVASVRTWNPKRPGKTRMINRAKEKRAWKSDLS